MGSWHVIVVKGVHKPNSDFLPVKIMLLLMITICIIYLYGKEDL